MANKQVDPRKTVDRIFNQFCRNMQKTINDSLGYYELRRHEDPYETNLDFGPSSRHYMSLEFNIGFLEEMNGVYSLAVDITPRGVLLNDSDRFLPESIRNTKAQIDPCLYENNHVYQYKYFDFVNSPGYAYLMEKYKKFRKELMKEVNINKKKDVYIGEVRLRSFEMAFEPEQTIEYYKKSCNGNTFTEKMVADMAERACNLSNFTLDMKTPTCRRCTIEEANRSKELLEIIKKGKIKVKDKPTNYAPRRVKKQFINPFTVFAKLFKKKEKDLNDEKEKTSFIKSNNFVSVLLMIIPIIIFTVNIILVLCLKDKFPISLSTDILWFNEAFTYKLCDLINNAIAGNDNFFIVILLWICMILAGIFETILSLIHLLLFLIVSLLAAIYGFGFQTMVGAIIVGISFPVAAMVLNKMSGYKLTAPILSLVFNAILVSLYLVCCYLTIGL